MGDPLVLLSYPRRRSSGLPAAALGVFFYLHLTLSLESFVWSRVNFVGYTQRLRYVTLGRCKARVSPLEESQFLVLFYTFV